MVPEFALKITDGNNFHIKVMHLEGELDEVSIEEVKKQLDPLLEDSTVLQLIFDLTKLSFINSKGIGYLVSVHTHLAKDGRSMILAGAKESVLDVINLVGLTNIIPHHATLKEILNKIA